MKTMTGKERMITALTGGKPDRVPCAPDISNMIPCRLTGRDFRDIYLRGDPPLWKAYNDAVDVLGIDGWSVYCDIDFQFKGGVSDVKFTSRKEGDRETIQTVYYTPKGELTVKTAAYANNPPTNTEKLIKNFKEDFEKVKYVLFPEITGYKTTSYDEQYKAFGDRGHIAVLLVAPGFHIYNEFFDGSLSALTYAYYDYPELFEELNELYTKSVLKKLEIILEVRPEGVLTGGSGSITLASPELFDKYSLPVIKVITAECKRAGIITGIHSCGKEMHIIKRCAEETDLNYINPLEIAPQGDSDLGTAKKLYGKKLALMGNLHTTDVMLKGSGELVELKSLEALLVAASGGGFVLSTGDQCGRDTPLENIKRMVAVCKEYGNYSSYDPERIKKRISELQALLTRR